MSRNIGSKSERTLNRIKAIVLTELLYLGESGSGRLANDVDGMSSKQLGKFLKRIKEIERENNGQVYKYRPKGLEPPQRIEYGDEWVEVEKVERDGKDCLKITSSRSGEKYKAIGCD